MAKCLQLARALSFGIVSAMLSASMLAQQYTSRPMPTAELTAEKRDSDSAPGAYVSSLQGSSKFTLGPADVIRVNVWKNPELSESVIIGPDGYISLPLIGELQVAGVTVHQLCELLSSRYSVYLTHAEVTVSLLEIHSRQVYVLGQVAKPGGYSLIAPMKVLQLIAQAGGLSTYANRKGIVVLRITKGRPQRIRFNYSEVIRGNDLENTDLQPGDTVIIP